MEYRGSDCGYSDYVGSDDNDKWSAVVVVVITMVVLVLMMVTNGVQW